MYVQFMLHLISDVPSGENPAIGTFAEIEVPWSLSRKKRELPKSNQLQSNQNDISEGSVATSRECGPIWWE